MQGVLAFSRTPQACEAHKLFFECLPARLAGYGAKNAPNPSYVLITKSFMNKAL